MDEHPLVGSPSSLSQLHCIDRHPGAEFDRAFKNMEGSPLQGREADGGLPPVIVQNQCSTLCTGNAMNCRGLPPAAFLLAGLEGSAHGGLQGGCGTLSQCQKASRLHLD